jgi:lambda family phage portal protein
MSSDIYKINYDHSVAESKAKESSPAMLSVEDLPDYSAYAGQGYVAPAQYSNWDGEKFYGGFGATQIQWKDYWTLRQRSAQLFNENLYARGLIRRLVTNEINTGLMPESCPDEEIIGVPEDSLQDWTETVENRFGIWVKSPNACDWQKINTFGAIQRIARMEALITGDVLVVLRINQQTKIPMVQIVDGAHIQNPTFSKMNLRKGHDVKHGVELDAQGRQVAFWIKQDDGTSKRLPAFGEKSGRKLAWLVYGTEKRHDDVRGTPILSLVLQSLKEIDRYRDSVQRKAVINAMLAMFIKKGEDKPGTLPIQGGAIRKDTVVVSDGDGTDRNFNITKHMPGAVLDELQTGEEPVGFHNQGTDEAFGTFEEAIIQAVAWANEIPPEILKLAFSNNYSASQAAINEFKIYLNMFWSYWGETFCTPIYKEWLISEVLMQKVQAPGLLESWRDPAQYDVFGAWMSADWYGAIKPSTDMLKQAKGSEKLLAMGLTTYARESRITTGTKFSKNIRRQKKEVAQLTEARQPMVDQENESQGQGQNGSVSAVDDIVADVIDAIEEVA